ncbi:MAG: hypothetical protein H7255_16845 [Ramlibacter sp.]|nr:hypothetical protein [Ramlibacter sp.]
MGLALGWHRDARDGVHAGAQMSTEQPAPPYPADVRARGWRFELDMEAVKASPFEEWRAT